VVLVDVPADALILREDTFGPVLPVVRARDAGHAVELANANPYGLGAAVFAGRRADRDQAAVDTTLARMAEIARTSENMIPAMLDAVRAEATLGEICGALRTEWGTYAEPARF